MTSDPLLHDISGYQLYARQFEVGAKIAASQQGITVIIDVFRASNTILELVKAGAMVKPVTTIEEAQQPKYDDFIKVGEDEGVLLSDFDYDNSPVSIADNHMSFNGKSTILRTTNGTRGIQAATGSKEVIVGTFRNFTAVVDYCLSAINNNIPVSFVAMGTMEEHRIEDEFCARMFVISILEHFDEDEIIQQITEEGNNPWIIDWREEIMTKRTIDPSKMDDYMFSLQLDTTSIVPIYNQQTGYLEPTS